MILWLRNIFAYCVCAVASAATARYIESTVAADALIPNLIAIVVALLAINVQTTIVIAVKLRELADKNGYNFTSSLREFRIAIFEQVALVFLSIALSAIVKGKVYVIGPLAIEIIAFFITFASLHIFIDTTLGILTALFPEEE